LPVLRHGHEQRATGRTVAGTPVARRAGASGTVPVLPAEGGRPRRWPAQLRGAAALAARGGRPADAGSLPARRRGVGPDRADRRVVIREACRQIRAWIDT